MTSIRAFSEILKDGDLGPEDRTRYAAIIHDEGTRLTRLLDDLIETSVLESGRIVVERRPVLLSEVLDRAVAAACPPGEGRLRLRLRRDPEAERIALVTDPGRLAQVFINLVSNAAKYCDAPAPELSIDARRRSGSVEIDFVDNGRGIPAPDRALIFEKFSRLSDSTSAGGAGLGLAICREIAARLGGRVDYVAGLGGAAFRVTLPAGAPGLADSLPDQPSSSGRSADRS